jgi:hypothetical protein
MGLALQSWLINKLTNKANLQKKALDMVLPLALQSSKCKNLLQEMYNN